MKVVIAEDGKELKPGVHLNKEPLLFGYKLELECEPELTRSQWITGILMGTVELGKIDIPI